MRYFMHWQSYLEALETAKNRPNPQRERDLRRSGTLVGNIALRDDQFFAGEQAHRLMAPRCDYSVLTETPDGTGHFVTVLNPDFVVGIFGHVQSYFDKQQPSPVPRQAQPTAAS